MFCVSWIHAFSNSYCLWKFLTGGHYVFIVVVSHLLSFVLWPHQICRNLVLCLLISSFLQASNLTHSYWTHSQTTFLRRLSSIFRLSEVKKKVQLLSQGLMNSYHMGLMNLLLIVCPDCTWHSAFSLFLACDLLYSEPVEYFRCFSFWDAAVPLLTPLSCLLSSQCFFYNHSSVHVFYSSCVQTEHTSSLNLPVLMYTWPVYLQVPEVVAQV